MAVTKTPGAAPAAVNAKKGKAVAKAPKAVTKSTVEKKPASHPSSAVMVLEAITKLNDKAGSSLYAIKKYIAEVHKVDIEKQGPFIRKALKKAVETGTLFQPKGKGSSFKLAVASKPAKKAAGEKKPITKKDKSTTSPTKKTTGTPKAKPAPKPAAAKKAPAKPKAKGPKTMKAKAPAKPKTVSPKKTAPKSKK